MKRAASLAAAAAVVIASPAYAQERTVVLDLPAGSLAQAVSALSRQAGVSIGLRDPALGRRQVPAVRGRMSAARALEKMLHATSLQARKVAPGAYLIDTGPDRIVARRPKPVQAAPKPTPPEPPQDIVVTASKRDVPLSVYPGGVEIIDGEQVSIADGTRGTQAVENRLASVASTHLGPGRNKLFIRGIADSSFVGPTQATVGQYWGNSRVTYAAPDPNLHLYDVKRIEVLEGPQGTLYGAGSLGGVMRVIPNSPDAEATGGEAWIGAEATEHGQPGADGGAVLNVPLVEGQLALRAVGFADFDGGYIDDTGRNLKDVNDVRTYGGRAALRYTPGDDWTVDLSLVGQRIDGDDSQYADRDSGGLSRSSTIAQPYRNDFWLADLVVDKRWGTLEFTGSVGYDAQNVFEQFEGVTLANPANSLVAPSNTSAVSAYTQTNDIHMLTAEARLARREAGGKGWLVGVSLLHNSGDVRRTMDALELTGVDNKVNEATLYGEYTFGLAEGLTVTGGGRLSYSELSGDAQDPVVPQFLALDASASHTRAETRLLPSVALAYRASDRLTLFARYQQSFRPGGIAVRREFIQHFQGDRIGTAEAGLRYRGDNFDLAATGAWTDWRNIQADLIDGYGFPITANIGNGRVYSLGLSGTLRPAPGLELDAAVYFNDGRLTTPGQVLYQLVSVVPANSAFATSAPDFNRLPNVADISGRVGFSYQTPVSGRALLTIDGYGRYVGKSTLGVGDVLGQLQGDYLDTGLEFTLGIGSRNLSLSLTNLFDSRGNRFALGSPFLVRDRNEITPLQPRTIRVGYEQHF